MRRIVIVTTPRTGSNLLLFSLCSHPDAISGGEWFNPYWKTKNQNWNLIKLMGYERGNPGFNEIIRGNLLVYLYRQDRGAQLASWKTACETGLWVADQETPVVSEFPTSADQWIDEADDAFRPIADLAFAYEQLVDHWRQTVETILRRADWPLVDIPMCLEKQKKSPDIHFAKSGLTSVARSP